MGLLKWACLTVTAPLWGPVAVTAATAVAGAAVAAGTAVAAGATAAASTVAAGAGAVASAAAGTAVGSAAIGAMGAVGSAIGTAAGAVGLSSVAAATGTAAGAASVGTIATSVAVGAQQGLSAKSKFDEAKRIYDKAVNDYNKEKEVFEPIQKETNRAVETLAKAKKKIAENLLAFNKVFGQLKNPSRFGKIDVKSDVVKGIDTNIDFDAYSISLEEFSTGILKAFTGGSLAQLALSGGISSVITTAGTGTAMSALHGAAASNAVLAAMGGGTIAHGGLGMAGGAMMMKGLAFAPALAFTGIMMNGKAEDALKDAERVKTESEKGISDMKDLGKYLKKLTDLTLTMTDNIDETQKVYNKIFKKIETIVYEQKHMDVAAMSDKEIDVFYAAIGLAKVMEIQAKTNFAKENATDDYSVNNLIIISEVKKCSYTNNELVKYGNLPGKTLSHLTDEVLQNPTKPHKEDVKTTEAGNQAADNGAKEDIVASYTEIYKTMSAEALFTEGQAYAYGGTHVKDMQKAAEYYYLADRKSLEYTGYHHKKAQHSLEILEHNYHIKPMCKAFM